jgi:hypothetical protein
MANAKVYALHLDLRRSSAWSEIGADIARGVRVAMKLVVTLVGSVTLVTAAIALCNEQARAGIVVALAPVQSMFSATEAAPVAGGSDVADADASEIVHTVVESQAEARQQRFVAQYLSRRYHVADEATRMLVSAAYESGREQALDPMLILAVMAIESSMNPFAESHVGAQGLMQVMTHVHADKFEILGGDLAALDPIANIKVGSAILKDLVSRGGSVERGLQLYVGAGNLEHDSGYGARVLSERQRIALAAQGKVDAAIASGMRLALVTDTKSIAAPSTSSPAPRTRESKL